MEATGECPSMYRLKMMLRRVRAAGFVLVAAVLFGQVTAGDAAAFDLVDPGEYSANQSQIDAWHDANPVVSSTRNLQPGPKIDVLQPEGGSNLTSPLTIDIRFRASRAHTMVMSSLRIDYWMGVFWSDITQRVLSAASVGPDSLRADGAELPAGRHLIRVQVADTSGLTAEREFRFTVTN